MMGDSGVLNLEVKIGIVVGSLLIVTVAAWIIKRYVEKRRAKRKTKVGNERWPMRMDSRENLVGQKLEGGDVFSLKRGYSPAMTSPHAPSYVLSPATALTNWGDSESVTSVSSSVIDIPNAMDGSVASIPAISKRPSPLRIKSFDDPLNDRSGTASSIGGSYLPPLPPPRSTKRPQANNNWVSPLDVHFNISTTSQCLPSRPRSYFLPQLSGQAKDVLRTPKNTDSFGGTITSEAASIIINPAATSTPEPPSQKSPTFNFNFFDPEVPTRPSRLSKRSIFPSMNGDESSKLRRSIESFIPVPNIPQNFRGPKSPGLDPNQYGEKDIIRNSVASKRSVSIYKPSAPHTPTEPTPSHHRITSSIYSTSASLNFRNNSRPASPNDANPQQQIAIEPRLENHRRARPTSTKRSKSSQNHSQFQNSLRGQPRALSKPNHRHSVDPGYIHRDPISHHRNLSGSVQGRSVDFDRPRASPFFNPTPVPSYSTTSSFAATGAESAGLPWLKAADPEPESQTSTPSSRTLISGVVGIVDSNRHSLGTVADKRGRSASEASQISLGFGELYDAYYRQSQGSRKSQISQINSNRRGSGILQDLSNVNVGVVVPSSEGKKPSRLRFAGVGVGQTIVEVASPVLSPAVGIVRRFEELGGKF